MKLKLLYFIISLLLSFSNAFSENTSEKFIITNINKELLPEVCILYFTNLSDTKKYPGSPNLGKIVILSLKEAFKKTAKTRIYFQENPKKDSDIIIAGEYKYSGKIEDPIVNITLKFLRKMDEKLLLTKNYISYTDRRIFDTIDKIKEEIEKFLDKIVTTSPTLTAEEMGFIFFKKFETGNENYHIYINDKLLTKFANKNYTKKISLKANESYIVKIKKDSDEKVVFEKEYTISPKETIEIVYEGKGSVTVMKLKNPELWKNYTYYINEREIETGKILTDVPVGKNNYLTIKDNTGKIVYREAFYLEDGEDKILQPKLFYENKFSLKFFSVIGEYWSFGLEYHFLRYFWTGINTGFNTFYTPVNQNLWAIFFTPEFGFQFFNYEKNLMISTGISGQFFFSQIDIKNRNTINTYYQRNPLKNGISIFLESELFGFFIRPALFYDLSELTLNISNLQFQISGGLRVSF